MTTREEQERSAGLVFRRFNRAVRFQIEHGLRPLRLTASQYATLAALESHGVSTNAQLAQLVFVSPQTMTQIMRRLLNRRLVTREPSPEDVGVWHVRLTEIGRQSVLKAHSLVRAAEDRLLAPLSREERTALLERMWACTDV